MYVNSIFKLELYGGIKLFADDTTTFPKSKLESDLQIIGLWSTQHKLTLNTPKSSIMLVSKRSIKPIKIPRKHFKNYDINYTKSLNI